jgi:hypothetical protein
MSKIRAALTHFGLSALVVGGLLLLIFFLWYPDPFFRIKGAGEIIMMLVGVDLVLGPVLTLIIYRAGKPGLKFDLSVIVLMQLVALVYGANSIYQERPEYLVFAVDRFNILAKKDVYWENFDKNRVAGKPVSGPLLVFAEWPGDEDALRELKDDILFSGNPDLEFRPRFWQPYENNVAKLIQKTFPLSNLKDVNSISSAAVDQFVKSNSLDIDRLNFAGVIGRNEDFAIVFDRETGRIEGAIAVNPWFYQG